MSAKKDKQAKTAGAKETTAEKPKEQKYVPEPFEKPVLIRTRSSHASGTSVKFYKCGAHMYACVCEHGTRKEGSRRYEMARAQSNPIDWCEECNAAAEAKREAKEARKKARAERRKKPTRAKVKKTEPKPEGVIQGAHIHHDGKKATIKAATFASRNGLNWIDLNGTGKGGTVTMADVEKAVRERATA
jgi:hypothetical protein